MGGELFFMNVCEIEAKEGRACKGINRVHFRFPITSSRKLISKSLFYPSTFSRATECETVAARFVVVAREWFFLFLHMKPLITAKWNRFHVTDGRSRRWEKPSLRSEENMNCYSSPRPDLPWPVIKKQAVRFPTPQCGRQACLMIRLLLIDDDGADFNKLTLFLSHFPISRRLCLLGP